MAPEEEAAWEPDREMQKEFDVASAAERDQRIEEGWRFECRAGTAG